ncbi:V-type ATP synthase subunit I [uncultured Proteiniphilum sp.]|mgnify:CR=1 FL=1|uniref:V-type ATP synthase subunit I n=1 Tax=uncultured Proteiniphilum sp. TaxID=497637 RepID=UPI00260D5142|nr:V-type ATP synthase subunit I [uncultured Proteiniphilum sp.]
MVATMKKFVFISFHKDYERFLHALRDLGMIHVAEQDNRKVDEEKLQDYLSASKRLSESVKKLKQLRDKKTAVPFDAADAERGMDIPAEIEKIENKKSALNQQLQVSLKERDNLRPWGNFDPENIHRLKEAGYHIRFFIVPAKEYDPEWESLYNAVVIQKETSKTYFVTITTGSQPVDELQFEEMKVPEVSLDALDKLIDSLQEKIQKQEETLKALSAEIPSAEAALKTLESDIFFTRVARSATPAAEEKLMLLQGWAPEENVPEITNYLESQDVYYRISDPAPEDNVPIKFKNNRFMRLFEPIAELYMLPKYNEIDLTPFFAPFYMIFFGLSLGDIGYGAFLLIVATLAKILGKEKIAGSMRGILSLVQILGFSTMVCGLLTGGFFGFSIYETNIPFFRNMKDQVYFDNSQMFMLSLILGVVQIMFAMLLKIVNRIKQFGWMQTLSTIGWFVLLLSVIVAYLFPDFMPMGGTIHLIVMGLSAVLIFFLNSPGKNPFMNVGLGLWDTYNMATGLLGDVLSYVRLFALGLSGGILASVFNSLALGLRPDNLVGGSIVFLLIFLFGHAINMFMNVLGAFVHPLRLTFVEFYKNAEFEGGGKKYNPFKK